MGITYRGNKTSSGKARAESAITPPPADAQGSQYNPLNTSQFDRTNPAALHYTTVKDAVDRLNHNGGTFGIINGARVTFNIKYKEITKDGKPDAEISGTVTIENWFNANLMDKSQRAKKPDRILTLKVDHKLMTEIPEHRSKKFPNKTELSAEEVVSILQKFADGLSPGIGERVEEYRDAPIRSGQRIQRLVVPDIDNMKGLGLCCRPLDPAVDKELIASLETKKVKEGEEGYLVQSQDFVREANKIIAAQEHLNPKEAGWRVRIADFDKNDYINEKNPYDSFEDFKKAKEQRASSLPVLNDIGLPSHRSKPLNSSKDNQIFYGEGMSQAAINYYNAIGAAKSHIQCFYGIRFEKYKLQDPSGKTTTLDKNGYEVKKGTEHNEHPTYIKNTTNQKGFFQKVKDKVCGFLFDGYGASHCRFIEFQKDEDINRFQIDAGKQISGFRRWMTDKPDINYWNAPNLPGVGGNRAFFELLMGAHQKDKMQDCYSKYLDLAQKFATEHLKANKKNLWKTSPFLNAVVAVCNGNKPKVTAFGSQEPAIVVLNIHFAKLENIQYYNANFFNANIHGAKIRNSIINGGFSGANFNYCDIGDLWFTRFLRKEWLRKCRIPEAVVAWFGNKTLLGFGSEADGGATQGAENVVFRGSKVRRGTVFEGAIKSGEMRFSVFSFSRFSADISEMAQFGIKVPPTFGPMKFIRFYGFRYKEEVEGLDARLKGIGYQFELFEPIADWAARAKQYSARNHVDFLQEEMNRVYEDGSQVEEDERLLWVDSLQWVPNGIGGRVHRLLFVGADTTKNAEIQNQGWVEFLADDDSMRSHFLYGHYSQGSSRVTDKNFEVKEDIRQANRENQTLFRQFIRNKNRFGSAATRQRKGNPSRTTSQTA